jgi:HTH-type transcriptional regulator / antitoxin HigA
METENRLPMSDLAVPPGEYLDEVMHELGMNQAELAQRMNRPVQAINEIVSGAKAIVPETALQLERVTGVPAHVWTGLEADYRLTLAKQQDAKQISEQVSLVDQFPYAELAKLGQVEQTRKAELRVRELCRFFGVVSLRQVQEVDDYAPAFRVGSGKASANALAAWLRMATLKAIAVETGPMDRKEVQAAIPEIRRMTCNPPDVFLPALTKLLAKNGIALVIQPHLTKTYVHGATFWLNADKAAIVMTLRGSWADVFWFSFFHELAHLLKHGKRDIFLEDGEFKRQKADLEKEADSYACDTLIAPVDYRQFVAVGDFSAAAILKFSRAIGIAPGIVTGRLQHDQHLPLTFHTHRVRYKWVP